jgi:porphobilinogen synthase
MLGPEKLRRTSTLRSLVRENSLQASDFILPLFLTPEKKDRKEIKLMPDVYQWSVDAALKYAEKQMKLGLKSFIFFGVVDSREKNSVGDRSTDKNGPVARALQSFRKEFGSEAVLIADSCFCEYTDHGHCGVFEKSAKLFERNSAKTLKNLAKQASAYAEFGADIIAPSGMMDGMVRTIRESLDLSGFERTAICSYAVKYASAFYGPFRDAANNSPLAGTDRKAYQMDPANRIEAMKEARLDLEEGADMLLVKPAMSYLDIIRDVKEMSDVPVGAYQVSGEYAALMAGARAGYLNENAVFMESLISIKRAGAKFILSYWAPKACEILKSESL